MIYNKITIESIYRYIDQDPLWDDFKNYLKSNSDQFSSERFELEKYDTGEPIGGFSESIIINIISSVIFEIGKYGIIELLKKLKSPIDRKNYMDGFPPKIVISNGLPGKISLKFRFNDKNLILDIPFPIESNDCIDNIDLKAIEKEFFYSNTATLIFDEKKGEYSKGKNIDSFA